jgi:DNA polymerase bacteriophage-type
LQNAAISRSWYAYQEAAIEAVENPDMIVEVPGVRNVAYMCSNNVLWCRLPSGGVLAYHWPRIVEERVDQLVWHNGIRERADTYTKVDIEGFIYLGLAKLLEGTPRKQVQYWTKDGYSWAPRRIYGGLQCENIVQATARDIQGEAMLRLDAAGYIIVAHTHDDILTENPLKFGSVAEFRALMSAPCRWTQGLPVAVDAWSGERYGDED